MKVAWISASPTSFGRPHVSSGRKMLDSTVEREISDSLTLMASSFDNYGRMVLKNSQFSGSNPTSENFMSLLSFQHPTKLRSVWTTWRRSSTNHTSCEMCTTPKIPSRGHSSHAYSLHDIWQKHQLWTSRLSSYPCNDDSQVRQLWEMCQPIYSRYLREILGFRGPQYLQDASRSWYPECPQTISRAQSPVQKQKRQTIFRSSWNYLGVSMERESHC